MKSRLADALFSPVQQRVLVLLYGHPERVFRCSELIRLVRGGTGGVHRFLRRLVDAGWATVTPVGNQTHYRANRACPAFAELRGLVLKTIGAGVAPRSGKERRAPARPITPSEPPPHRRVARVALPESEEEPSVPAPRNDEGWKAW